MKPNKTWSLQQENQTESMVQTKLKYLSLENKVAWTSIKLPTQKPELNPSHYARFLVITTGYCVNETCAPPKKKKSSDLIHP